MALRTTDYSYDLPAERVAQHPLEPRDRARMLVLNRDTGMMEHRHIFDLPSYLRAGDLLVLNDTRVIPARLIGTKSTGGQAEIFLIKRQEGHVWQAMVRGRKLETGSVVILAGPDGNEMEARIVATLEGSLRLVEFATNLEEALPQIGHIPLPPYIHTSLAEPERYQTVYSRHEGSIAAPTAGLHFTSELLLQLRSLGVHFAFVTLHVGLDTFRPITEEDPSKHAIHSEWLEFSADTAHQVNTTRLQGGRIVAVGTTSVRALETAAKIALGLTPSDPAPVDLACGWRTTAAWTGETDLYIMPGHHFRAVDAMLTNFHLPRSTLLLLVSAFAGHEPIRHAYEEAIHHEYRFFSFGDAMLIL